MLRAASGVVHGEKFTVSSVNTGRRAATGQRTVPRHPKGWTRTRCVATLAAMATDLPSSSAELPPITRLLQLAADGDRAALDQVYASLYPELKRVARARLRQQGRGDSMGTTTLLHESFVRLVNASDLRLQDRRHFFAYAARTMRNIIIDSARERLAERRGGDSEHVGLDGDEAIQVADTSTSEELVRVSEALLELEKIDPELAELVDMRYFGGYTETEIAELQEVTERTIRRRWDKARAWLYVALNDASPAAPTPPPA
jgi:RNA polymerase sigma factor (TIGR02999 family)